MNEQAFEVWAPDASPWSLWAKPVLFAQAFVASGVAREAVGTLDVSRYPAARPDTALVLDLPGRSAAQLGIALAQRGWRPVPLYNGGTGSGALVNVEPLIETLVAGAITLSSTNLAPDAPPAFLLDSERMKGEPEPGRFDNRWLVFPQDFPSATFLKTRGIGRVLVVQDGDAPREDLAHVLLRWQKAGIELALASPQAPEAPRPLTVRKPSGFRRAWYRALAAMGLRRANVGGFGALVPVATASSG